MPETMVEQAKRIHRRHVEADGAEGHSARDEWSRCEELECEAFRASVSGPAEALEAVALGHDPKGRVLIIRDTALGDRAGRRAHMAAIFRAGFAAAEAAQAMGDQVRADADMPSLAPTPAERQAADAAYRLTRRRGTGPEANIAEALTAAWDAALREAGFAPDCAEAAKYSQEETSTSESQEV